MNCTTLGLRDNWAATAPEAGVWTYNGFHSTNPTGPFTSTAPNPLFSGIPNGSILPYGDNPTFDKTGKTTGYYSFTYNYSGGFVDAIIAVYNDTISAGTSTTVSYSSSDATPYNLLTVLGGTSGGTWTDLDGAGAGFSGGILTPSTVGAGTFRFEYSLVEAGFDDLECGDCPPLTAIVTAEIGATFSVSIGASTGTCTFDMAMENASTTTANQGIVSIAADNSSPNLQYRMLVDSTCDGSILNTVVNQTLPSVVVTFNNNVALTTGGYFVSIKLYSTTSGAITVPLAPGTAVLTGSGGTVNVADLTFNSLSPYTFATAIGKCIRNYLDTLGKTNGVHYDFVASVPGFSSLGEINILFGSKHNPSSEWIGPKRSDHVITYSVSGGAPITGEDYFILDNNININYTYSNPPCPSGGTKLQYVTNYVVQSTFVDAATTDYNSIILLGSTINFTINGGSSNLSQGCSGYTLTATTMNCGGSPTFLWNTGDTTSAIVVSAGPYSVTANCPSPLSSDMDSIVV